MRVRPLLSVAMWCGAALAQAIPEVKLPPSPQGQAAIQVAGMDEDARGWPGLSRCKWIVVDYGRPLLRGIAVAGSVS